MTRESILTNGHQTEPNLGSHNLYPNSLETPSSDFNGDAMRVALRGNGLRGSRCWWHLLALELHDDTVRVLVALGLSMVLGGTSIVVEILELCISMGSNQFWLVQTSCE